MTILNQRVIKMMINPILEKIFGLKRRSKRLIQVSTDTVLIVSCFFLAMWLRLDDLDLIFVLKPWLTLIAVIPATIIAFIRLGLYKAVIRYISSKVLGYIGIGVLLSANIMFITSQIFSLQVPRSVPFIYLAFLFLTASGVRFTLRQIYLFRRQIGIKPVAIYGAGESGRQLFNALEQSREYKPVLFIDDNPRLDGVQISGLNVMPFSRAKTKINDFNLKVIMLAMPNIPNLVKKNIVENLENCLIEVKTLPKISEFVLDTASIRDLREVSIEELLGRDTVPPMAELMDQNILNKSVLITGAGGSIGTELCRQVILQRPKRLVLIDISEYALYTIQQELEQIASSNNHPFELIPLVCSIQKQSAVERIFDTFDIETIYHAAAYKHVPLMELNIVECIQNNVFGTKILAKLATKAKVKNFILISTDKAVRPTNFMGASKRLSELICQAMSNESPDTCFSMVRFGNVLGSSGSVIPRFRSQIQDGGPVTLTHKEVQRYFMTIKEASELVIQAGSMANGGDLFVLDMGQPIKILDVAKKMIQLNGLRPVLEDAAKPAEGEIGIKVVGLRPGEKLYEELLIGKNQVGTKHSRIMVAHEEQLSSSDLETVLSQLFIATETHDINRIYEILLDAPIGFNPTGETQDLVWVKKEIKGSQKKAGSLRIINT